MAPKRYRITKSYSKYLVTAIKALYQNPRNHFFAISTNNFFLAILSHFEPKSLKSCYPSVIPWYRVAKSYSKYLVTSRFIKSKASFLLRLAQIVHFYHFFAILGQNGLKSWHPIVIPGYRISKSYCKYLVKTFKAIYQNSMKNFVAISINSLFLAILAKIG